ncbi:MAG: hypothetical protein AAGN35_11230 [Bacteroidota bacterium]
MAEAKTPPPRSRVLSRVLFGLVLGVLFLPVLQEWTGAVRLRKLAGVENVVDTIPPTDTAWLSGQFQNNFELRHYRWMGLRPAMVRLHNQLDYFLFGEVYRSIMIGEGDELFRRGSMQAMRGLNYLGEEEIRLRARKTALLRDFLAARGTRLLVVFTPSKLRCMPEKLPEYVLPSRNPNNYDAMRAALLREGVPLVDLEAILKARMELFSFRIFPKTGTHWTDFGAVLGAQHIVQEMNRRDGRTYRRFRAIEQTPSGQMRDTDADAGDLLNLIRDIPPDSIHYHTVQFQDDGPGIFRPKTLVIGDSFWWKVYNQDVHKKVFAPGSQYRYYNYEVFSDQWEGARYPQQFDLGQTLSGLDWLIICINEGNMHRYPFNFTDQVLRAFNVQSP